MWAEIRGKKLVMIVIAGVMALFAGALLIVGLLGFTSGGSLLSPAVATYCVIGIGVMVPVVLAVMWLLRRQILKEEEAKVVRGQRGE